MLKRDFIMAMIEDFTKAIVVLMQKRQDGNDGGDGKNPSSRKILNDAYESLGLSEEERMRLPLEKLAEKFEAQERPACSFMDILANLLYEESYLSSDKTTDMLRRALDLYEYSDEHDNTFSFERKGKIDMLKNLLSTL